MTVDPAGPDERPAATLFEGAESIEEAIGLAIGAASMCWENPAGAGVFDSTRAARLVKQLYEHVQLRWSLADARSVSPSPATTEPEKLRRQVEAHKAAAQNWHLRYEEAQQRFLDLAGSLGADSATTEAEPDEAADELLVKTVIAASGGQAWLDGPTEHALTARIVINALRASLDARRRQARPSAVPAVAPVPAEADAGRCPWRGLVRILDHDAESRDPSDLFEAGVRSGMHRAASMLADQIDALGDQVLDAVRELRCLTRCTCRDPYPLKSGRRDPNCLEEYRADVEVLATAVGVAADPADDEEESPYA